MSVSGRILPVKGLTINNQNTKEQYEYQKDNRNGNDAGRTLRAARAGPDYHGAGPVNGLDVLSLLQE